MPPTTTVPAPTLPIAPGAVAANARAFAQSWNANVVGTPVPALSAEDVSDQENGPEATTFIAKLSDRTGLVGVVRNDDGSVAEVLLVWIPGGDEAASNERYRQAFDVLVRTLNPVLPADERTALASDLGLSSTDPPFPAGAAATAEVDPNRYTRFVRDTSVSPDTAVISVTASRPR